MYFLCGGTAISSSPLIAFEIPFEKYPLVFVRLKGRNGSVREIRALLDPVCDYCVLPKPDAFRLGYPEAAHDDPITIPPNLLTMSSSTGFSQGMLIKLQELTLGDIKLQNVDFVAYDVAQSVCFDAILGRTFFSAAKCSLELDYSLHKLKITRK